MSAAQRLAARSERLAEQRLRFVQAAIILQQSSQAVYHRRCPTLVHRHRVQRRSRRTDQPATQLLLHRLVQRAGAAVAPRHSRVDQLFVARQERCRAPHVHARQAGGDRGKVARKRFQELAALHLAQRNLVRRARLRGAEELP